MVHVDVYADHLPKRVLKTKLLYAIDINAQELIISLIKHGANPGSGMKRAVGNKNIEIVKILLKNGADINEADKDDSIPATSLMLAATSTYNRHYNPTRPTAYHQPSLEIVNLLIEHGADINARTKYGNIVSYIVCNPDRDGTEEVKYKYLRKFIELGVSVNVPCRNGATPLANLFRFKYPAASDRYYHNKRKEKQNKKLMEYKMNTLRNNSKVVQLIENSGGIEKGNPNGNWLKRKIQSWVPGGH